MQRRKAAFAGGLALFALNMYICLPWLRLEYLDGRQSIEGAFIGIARYVLEHPGERAWFPLWYNGIPFENTYPPLLHYTVAGTAWLFGLTVQRAYHIVTGIFYALGPVTIYALAYRLSGRLRPSIVTGLLFSLWSPCIWLLPTILRDTESLWSPRRFQVLSAYGGAPQVAALTLLPIAIVAVDFGFSKPRAWRFFLAAIALAVVPLVNWIGAFALAWGLLAYSCTQERQEPRRAGLFLGVIGTWAYGLAACWIPPSMVADIGRNSQLAGGDYPMNAGRYALLILLCLLALGVGLWFRGRPLSFALRFGIVFSIPMLGIPLVEEITGFYLIPQPHRYQLEAEAAVVLVAVFALVSVTTRLPRPVLLLPALAILPAGALLVAHHRSFAERYSRPLQPESMFEWQIAQKLAQEYPGRRVYTHGSVRYWLLAFHDIPQFGGGFGPGVRLPLWWMADRGIYLTEGHGELALTWLRAYGIDVMWVGNEQTREIFHMWKDGGKFEGILKPVWRESGDALYEIPRRSRSLAHIIPRSSVVRQAPTSFFDATSVEEYVRALEDPESPRTDFQWLSSGEAVIEAELGEDEVLSVQVTYDDGWRAECNSARLAISADGLGQLIVWPSHPGPCRVMLRFQPSLGPRVLALLSWIAGVGVLCWRFPFYTKPARRIR